MTDIDLTEAVEEAAKSIMSEYEDGLPSWRDLDSQGQTWYRGIAKGALEAALPHILAQVEARVKPAREDLIATLKREFGSVLAHDPYNPARFWGLSADAVLALFNGKTEQEVREEVAAGIEAIILPPVVMSDRLPWDDLNVGRHVMRQQAARIARGGDGR